MNKKLIKSLVKGKILLFNNSSKEVFLQIIRHAFPSITLNFNELFDNCFFFDKNQEMPVFGSFTEIKEKFDINGLKIYNTSSFYKNEKVYTLDELANDKCIVANDGTIEELKEVLCAAFPSHKDRIMSFHGTFPFYGKSKTKIFGVESVNKYPEIEAQSVKVFLKELSLPVIREIKTNPIKWPEEKQINIITDDPMCFPALISEVCVKILTDTVKKHYPEEKIINEEDLDRVCKKHKITCNRSIDTSYDGYQYKATGIVTVLKELT